MKAFTKIVLMVIGVIIIFAAAFMVFAVWSMNGHGADPQRFAQITNGMTMSQIESVMGKPKWNRVTDERTTLWTYGHTLKWCTMQIRFGTNELVELKIHDH